MTEPDAEPQPSTEPVTTAPPPPDDDVEQPFFVRKCIAVLGARGVGKTAASIQCALNRFQAEYTLTFETTYKWKPVVDDIHYDVSIVDTDGQDDNSFFGPQHTIGVDGYILMFSVRDESSFEVVKAVNDKLLDTLNVFNTKGTSEVPRILVGNQIDKASERQVPFAVAKEYADDQDIPYLETSALTSHNVRKVFTEVLRIIQRNLHDGHTSQSLPERAENRKKEATPANRTCLVQ